MKRIVSIMLIFILALNFAGCSQGKGSKVSKSNSEKIKYTDDQILFAAQDRIDIEGDRYTVYSYNYKGELLDSSDSSSAIGYYSANGLVPALEQNTGKVGFVDKDGVFVIEPIYTDAAPFSDDGIALAVKYIDGESKYGYINSKGEEVIPFIYDYATSFYNFGYAVVRVYQDEETKYFIIDKKGNVLIELNSYSVELTKDYFIIAENDEQIISDYSGNKVFSFNYDYNAEEYDNIIVKGNDIFKYTYKLNDNSGRHSLIKSEIFDGKKFVAPKKDYEITSKHVATTISGVAFGVTKNGETVIPFEYDSITEYGEYFVAVKYNDNYDSYDQIYGIYYDQVFDIYDKNFNKTAENIEYAFYDRHSEYGQDCQLPNGYFQITKKCDSERLYGIVDYTGKIIVEPVFYRGIKLWTYEGMGRFQ